MRKSKDTVRIFDRENATIWQVYFNICYVLATHTSASLAGPKFKIDSQMAWFHFAIKFINGPYL